MKAIDKRLRELEALASPLPHAFVTFADGRKERLDLGDLSRAFFDGNRVGVVAVEWERGTPDTPLFQLLESPGTWTELTAGFDLNEMQKGLDEK